GARVAGQIPGILAVQRVGCGGQQLARLEPPVTPRAVAGAHADPQPYRGVVEDVAEVELDGEQAISDGDVLEENRASDFGTFRCIVEEVELEVLWALGWQAAL